MIKGIVSLNFLQVYITVVHKSHVLLFRKGQYNENNLCFTVSFEMVKHKLFVFTCFYKMCSSNLVVRFWFIYLIFKRYFELFKQFTFKILSIQNVHKIHVLRLGYRSNYVLCCETSNTF